jgi:Na+(H+)/acetate symporter ActP
MADVLSFRLKQKPVRLAAAISTMTVSLFYLLAQMAARAAWWHCCSTSRATVASRS